MSYSYKALVRNRSLNLGILVCSIRVEINYIVLQLIQQSLW